MVTFFLVIRMNECVELSELKFKGRPGFPAFDDFGKGADNIEPMFYITLVVVCHIQNEKIFEIEFLVQFDLRLLSRFYL